MALRRERGSGSLLKRKNSRIWIAQIRDKTGRQRQISTRTSVKQEALSFLRNLLSEKDRGLQFSGDLRRLRYGHLRAALLHNYHERGNKSLQVTSDGEETVWGLRALDTFFLYDEKTLGVPVARITTDSAREFAQKRSKEGAANGTINGSLALLRRMLTLAHEDGKIFVNLKIRLLKGGAPRQGFLGREQFNTLLSHLPENLKPLITFLYYCGVRLGEAKQIEWQQVDLREALIRLPGEQTKNNIPRTLPLPDVLVRMLETAEDKSGCVFDATNLRKEWYRACVAAGLGTLAKVEGKPDPRYHGLIIHDLRRSAVRNLRKAGVEETVAMKISGHKTRDIFTRYDIVDEDDVVLAMRKVEVKADEIDCSKTEVLPRERGGRLLKP